MLWEPPKNLYQKVKLKNFLYSYQKYQPFRIKKGVKQHTTQRKK